MRSYFRRKRSSGGHCSDSTAYGNGLIGAAIASGISDFNANSFNGLTVYVPKNANGSACVSAALYPPLRFEQSTANLVDMEK